MQVVKDSRRAVLLAKRVLKGRRAYFGLRKLLEERGPLPTDHFRIGVYFADSDVNLYQMRQWYAPLQELSRTHPVLVISRNAAGAKSLIEESGLQVAYAPKVTSLENLIARQPLDIILYVNQNTRNFQMMRYGKRWHVFINHGESDKMYMTSNQYKTYDYAFVAGVAARDRLEAALWEYPVKSKTFMIGRPQADHFTGVPPYPNDDRIVVLYAPTWEGDRPAASYGSVHSHGERLVRELIATGRHRVVYRPHPRSGVVDAEFGAANQRIITAIREANRTDPKAHHVYDTSPTLDWQLSSPDVAICDISAMVYDRLATGKPLLITRPLSEFASIDFGGYLGVCEWVHANDERNTAVIVEEVMHDAQAKDRLGTWSQKYFGDTAPGAPTRRFHEAIDTLLTRASAYSTPTRSSNDPV